MFRWARNAFLWPAGDYCALTVRRKIFQVLIRTAITGPSLHFESRIRVLRTVAAHSTHSVPLPPLYEDLIQEWLEFSVMTPSMSRFCDPFDQLDRGFKIQRLCAEIFES